MEKKKTLLSNESGDSKRNGTGTKPEVTRLEQKENNIEKWGGGIQD